MWTPELVATVDATLAGTVTKHVGVKQGGGQEAEGGDGGEDKGSADNCKRRLKLAWWEQRTQWHYRHWKQFKKAFVAYWVAEAERRGNMAVDDQPANSARSSQQAASGGTGTVRAAPGQPPPPPPTHPGDFTRSSSQSSRPTSTLQTNRPDNCARAVPAPL
jgi:hypothetical protein